MTLPSPPIPGLPLFWSTSAAPTTPMMEPLPPHIREAGLEERVAPSSALPSLRVCGIRHPPSGAAPNRRAPRGIGHDETLAEHLGHQLGLRNSPKKRRIPGRKVQTDPPIGG